MNHHMPLTAQIVPSVSTPPRPELPLWKSRRVAEYIETNLDRPIRNSELADVARLSRSHFCRAFHNSTRQPTARVHHSSSHRARAGVDALDRARRSIKSRSTADWSTAISLVVSSGRRRDTASLAHGAGVPTRTASMGVTAPQRD